MLLLSLCLITLPVTAQSENDAIKRAQKLAANISANTNGKPVQLKELLPQCDEAAKLFGDANDKRSLAELFRDCGIVYKRINDREQAVVLLTRSLDHAKEVGATPIEHSALVWLGNIYEQLYRLNDAVESYERAHKLATGLNDKELIAHDLSRLGALLFAAGDSERAIDHFSRAILANTESKDVESALNNIHYLAWLLRGNGRLDDALKLFQQGAGFAKSRFYRDMAILFLRQIGDTQMQLGNFAESLISYEEALFYCGVEGRLSQKAVITASLGDVNRATGKYQTARDLYNQSLDLAEKSGSREAKIIANLKIATLYSAMGDSRSALRHYVLVYVSSSAAGYAQYQIESFIFVAKWHISTGDHAKALEMCEQIVDGLQKFNLRPLEPTAFRNVAQVYKLLGKTDLQLDYLNRALESARYQGSTFAEIRARIDIAAELIGTEKKAVALEHLEKCLELAKLTGNVDQKAIVYQRIGMTYMLSAETYVKSRKSLTEGLLIDSTTGNKAGEADSLHLLMRLEGLAKNSRLSVFYGKASAAKIQELRAASRVFDVETQKSLLAKMQDVYRALAHALIEAGRLSEAAQILNLLKDQQFYDAADPLMRKWSIPMTGRESHMLTEYTRLSKLNTDTASELAFNKRSGTSNAGRVKTNLSDDQLKTAATSFRAILDRAERDFVGAIVAEDKTPRIFEIEELQAALGRVSKESGHNVAAIYTLVGSNNFRTILISADTIDSVSQLVKGDDLNGKALRLWSLLQSDRYDTTILGKELFDVVFKHVEEKLPKNTQTILWSPDGNLRYIPIGALFDGSRYLIERYNSVNFTRTDFDAMTKLGSPTAWTATGFGTSKAHEVSLFGNSIAFSALPGVIEELGTVFTQHGVPRILEGETFLDEKFTRASIIDKSKAKRPIVHISSHFSFRPGDDARSFLLLGDGTAFTLADMKKQTGMFAGVELLTLSACNTAAQQADADGREVDAFFELAQRLGARSVMATLWPVADNSTPWLMREFYDLKVNKKQSKAQALRNAQLALLKGSAITSRSTNGTNFSPVEIIVEDAAVGEITPPSADHPADKAPALKSFATRAEEFAIAKKDSKPFVADPARPFAHPFYWSPFVLIGNWR